MESKSKRLIALTDEDVVRLREAADILGTTPRYPARLRSIADRYEEGITEKEVKEVVEGFLSDYAVQFALEAEAEPWEADTVADKLRTFLVNPAPTQPIPESVERSQ